MYSFIFTYRGFLFFTIQSKNYQEGIYKAKLQCYNDFGHDIYIKVMCDKHDTGKRFKYTRRYREFKRIDNAKRTRKNDLQNIY